MSATSKPANSLQHVLFGSLIGTTIEFFDFYIYANAAVLVFPNYFSRELIAPFQFYNLWRHFRLLFLHDQLVRQFLDIMEIKLVEKRPWWWLY